MSTVSRFKSPEKEVQYLAAYDATLALWDVPHEPLNVQTSFGTTHINAAGSTDLPPMLLLHGFGMSSTQWYPNVAALSQFFRVYALDTMNQMGRSVPTGLLLTRQQCADWLVEVLDALNIERATFGGHSHGGWLTLNLALTVPQCVERMVLLSPAPAIAPLRRQLFLRMIPVLFIPTRFMFYRFFQWMTTMPLGNGQPFVEQFIMSIKCFKPQEMKLPVTSVFTDDELRQINIPTLLLIGEHEVVYKPSEALERARRLMPQIEAELIAGGGHLFPIDQADATNARMLEFLRVR